MRIGAKLPNSGPLPVRLGVPAMARALEAAGYDPLRLHGDDETIGGGSLFDAPDAESCEAHGGAMSRAPLGPTLARGPEARWPRRARLDSERS